MKGIKHGLVPILVALTLIAAQGTGRYTKANATQLTPAFTGVRAETACPIEDKGHDVDPFKGCLILDVKMADPAGSFIMPRAFHCAGDPDKSPNADPSKTSYRFRPGALELNVNSKWGLINTQPRMQTAPASYLLELDAQFSEDFTASLLVTLRSSGGTTLFFVVYPAPAASPEQGYATFATYRMPNSTNDTGDWKEVPGRILLPEKKGEPMTLAVAVGKRYRAFLNGTQSIDNADMGVQGPRIPVGSPGTELEFAL